MSLPFLNKPKNDQLIKPSSLTTFSKGVTSLQDIIAPPAIEVDFNDLKIGNTFFRTLFVAGYPRFVSANWLYPLISFNHTLEIAMYVYPVESKEILENLKRKIGEMEATIQSDVKRGRVIDPTVQVALDDALSLQQQLAKGAERFFQFGLYITIHSKNKDELDQITKQVTSTLGSLMIVAKPATLQMEDGFKTTLPLANDKLMITRNMDTTSLATTFPFSSSELTANEGILYGINEHNDSLIIFDRFTLENANSVVFGKSGSGKSFMIKLEVLRSLMFDTEVIVIDPEDEYQILCTETGGELIDFNFKAGIKINPFDLAGVYKEGENELGQKILSLHALMRIVMGNLTPTEDAFLDRALLLTYQKKGITQDPKTQQNAPPSMIDLRQTLIDINEPVAKTMAERLEKFTQGSLAGLFDQKSNLDIRNPFTVFSIRDLEDQLRPIAMFIILDYIWTRIKKDQKKRILIVDEAWYLMKYPDSAMFLYSIAKRARKYYLGLTTITQDVEDFLISDYGKAIITNSSIQILLKMHPAAIDKIAEVFYLSEGEKQLLLAAGIGEGLFFAGPAHVAVKVIASSDEYPLVSTKPSEKKTPLPIASNQTNSSQTIPLPNPSLIKPPLSPPVGLAGSVPAPLAPISSLSSSLPSLTPNVAPPKVKPLPPKPPPRRPTFVTEIVPDNSKIQDQIDLSSKKK